MSAVIASTIFTFNTSTGNQDITTSDLGGLTPKLAIFRVGRAVSDDTDSIDAIVAISATDGTTHFTSGKNDPNNEGTSRDNHLYDDRLLYLSKIGTEYEVDCEASFVSWLTNGIRINWTDAPTHGRRCIVTFFAGDDVTVDVGSFNPAGTQNDSTSVNCGFEPDIVFINGHYQNYTSYNFEGFPLTYGICVNDGSETQCSWNHHFADNASTTLVKGILSDDRVAIDVRDDDYELEITSFDSSGFDVTTRESDATTSDDWSYIAVKVANHQVSLDKFDALSTDSGEISYSVGFEPQHVYLIASALQSWNTMDYGNSSGALNQMVLDADDQTLLFQTRDNVSTTNCQSRLDTAFRMWDGDKTVLKTGDASLYSSGFKIDYATNPDTNTRRWFALSIEVDVEAKPQFYRTYRNRRT